MAEIFKALALLAIGVAVIAWLHSERARKQ
jgi:hypothetical protein